MIIKKQIFGSLWIVVLLMLVACNKGAQTAVTAPEVDIAALPDTVDVQTVSKIWEQPGVLLLDVREPWEYDEGHIPGVILIPMNEVPHRLNEIPTDQEVIVTCRSGNRSGQITDLLRQQGYTNVHNMAGGIVAWEAAGLPVER